MRRAWVDVDLDALRRNARALASRARVPLLPMVKADAYGLGAVDVARALESLNPWGFGVATLTEALELRTAGIERRILVFTPLLEYDFEEARRLNVTPTLGDPAAIEAWIDGGAGPWHLAIETGMHRAGLEWWRVGELASLARRAPPEGAFTHFHSADLDDDTMRLQEERFREALSELGARPQYLHADNSPAIVRRGQSPWDLARPGVALYGVGGVVWKDYIPEPVAHVRARIVEIHRVKDGECVSYNATWHAHGDRRVATLALGYADGYRRAFAAGGEAIVHGVRVPVVGRITMDMTMIDVTGVDCSRGDVATLLGRDGNEHIDINEMSQRVDVLSYEILVGLELRLPRIVHLEGEVAP